MKRFVLGGLMAAALTAAALAQNAPRQHVRGTIASLDGNVLTVAAVAGTETTKVTLAPNYRVQYVVKATLASITPGSWVGTAAVPQADGSLRALEVHIFPPNLRGVGAGTNPYDLGPTSTMTNGNVDTIGATKVDNVGAGVLTISYEGGQKVVTVPATTPIVGYAPADPTALVKGAHVNVIALKAADGSLTAANVSVGKDGLIPPM